MEVQPLTKFQIKMEITSDKLFNCDKCEKQFSVKSSLQRHIKYHHSKVVEIFICDVCLETFHIKTSLIRHVRNKHPKTAVTLLQDQKTVGLNRLNCDYCTQTFSTKRALVKHCKNKHPSNFCGSYNIQLPATTEPSLNEQETVDLNRLNCDCCAQTFSTRRALVKHYKIKHPSNLHASNNIQHPDTTEPSMHVQKTVALNRLNCDVCAQTFSTRRALLKHRKIKHPSNLLDFNNVEHFETTKPSLHAQKTVTLNRLNCDSCDKTFFSKSGLRKHCNYQHSSDPDGSTQAICIVCNAVFSRKYHLIRHMKVHQQGNKIKAKLSCAICDFFCSTFNTLSMHYANQHDTEITKEVMTFPSMYTFRQWKEEEEKRSCNKYVKHGGTAHLKNGCKFTTYHCHRSGVYKPAGKGLRRLKIQGSKKISRNCPSRIYAKLGLNGEILVNYIATHIGHDPDLCHMSLTSAEKAAVATKISMRIPFEDILSEVRDSIKVTNLQRYDLLTRRDLNNISKNLDLFALRGRIHEDDAIRVASWAKENSESDDHPVTNENILETTEIMSNRTSQLIPEIGSENQEQFLKKKQEYIDEFVKLINDHVNCEKDLNVAQKITKPLLPTLGATCKNQNGNNKPSETNT